MTVYIDVLFAVNMIINYLLLLATSKITRQSTSAFRVALGSFAGAVYAVCMFFPQIKALYTIAAKIAVSFILVAITFNIKKVRTFFKTVCVFYITSFIFGGISLGIFYFTGAGSGTVISNGIFYYNLSLRLLIISSAIAYGIIRTLWKVCKSDRMRDFKKIDIYLHGKNVSLNALVDTGNMLNDPLTQTPVVVAEFERLKSILPQNFNTLYTELYHSPESIMLSNDVSEMAPRLRIIPFSSLGASESMLLGFKPDAIKIEKQIREDIIIGIYRSHLSKNKDYNALLNPEIISGGMLQ